jgi:hypothetical protein
MRALLYTVGMSSGNDPAWVEWWVEAHWPEPNPEAGGDIESEMLWNSAPVMLEPGMSLDTVAAQQYLEHRRIMETVVRRHAKQNSPNHTSLVWRPPTRQHFAQYGVGIRWIGIVS